MFPRTEIDRSANGPRLSVAGPYDFTCPQCEAVHQWGWPNPPSSYSFDHIEYTCTACRALTRFRWVKGHWEAGIGTLWWRAETLAQRRKVRAYKKMREKALARDEKARREMEQARREMEEARNRERIRTRKQREAERERERAEKLRERLARKEEAEWKRQAVRECRMEALIGEFVQRMDKRSGRQKPRPNFIRQMETLGNARLRFAGRMAHEISADDIQKWMFEDSLMLPNVVRVLFNFAMRRRLAASNPVDEYYRRLRSIFLQPATDAAFFGGASNTSRRPPDSIVGGEKHYRTARAGILREMIQYYGHATIAGAF